MKKSKIKAIIYFFVLIMFATIIMIILNSVLSISPKYLKKSNPYYNDLYRIELFEDIEINSLIISIENQDNYLGYSIIDEAYMTINGNSFFIHNIYYNELYTPIIKKGEMLKQNNSECLISDNIKGIDIGDTIQIQDNNDVAKDFVVVGYYTGDVLCSIKDNQIDDIIISENINFSDSRLYDIKITNTIDFSSCGTVQNIINNSLNIYKHIFIMIILLTYLTLIIFYIFCIFINHKFLMNMHHKEEEYKKRVIIIPFLCFISLILIKLIIRTSLLSMIISLLLVLLVFIQNAKIISKEEIL